MNWFSRADEWLLDKLFQRFADWFQQKTGRNSFFLAFLCLWISIALFTMHTWVALTHGRNPLILLVFIFALWVVLGLLKELDREEKRWDEKQIFNRMMNPLRARYPYRVIFVQFCLYTVTSSVADVVTKRTSVPEEIFHALAMMFFLFHLYFGACTPKPPRAFFSKQGVLCEQGT